MSDLDVQIDVPDDDDLDSSVRVINGDLIPPWLKALAIAILGGLAAVMAAAFLLGRSQGAGEPPETTAPASPTTELASAPASPVMGATVQAVEAWEDFARTGELDRLGSSFDPDGPQYAVLSRSVASPRPDDVGFEVQNLTQQQDGDFTTVSTDLVVTGAGGEIAYPYDFVYLAGSDQVWTVIDRRSPGTVALPPNDDVVEAAGAAWSRFVAAVGAGDGPAASEAVGADTRELADQLARAAQGQTVEDRLLAPELFQLLTDRVANAGATDATGALVAVLDTEQKEAMAVGELRAWTLVDDGRIVASLDVGGQSLATVPFVATTEGWVFDLKSALESTGSTP